MASDLQTAALEATDQAKQPLQSLDHLPAPPRITDEERNTVLKWGRNTTSFPVVCLHQLFEDQATKNPQNAAVAFHDDVLSYGELNRRANQLAHYLRELGVGPDERVAICVERRFEMIVAVLAVLKAGGAYVPLDPAYPVERLRFILDDSAPVVLLTQGRLADLFPHLSSRVPVIDLADSSAWDQRSDINPEAAAVGLSPAHLAYILYTSGSTGKPKGVMIEHRNVVNFVSWGRSVLRHEVVERTLFGTSLSFDLSIHDLFIPLAAGATAVLVPDVIYACRHSLNVTHINAVPTAIGSILETGQIPASVREIATGGEPVKPALVDRIFAATNVASVWNLYGPTETTVYSAGVELKRGEPNPGHIGRPIADTQIYIVGEDGELVPPGVEGEIYIGGAGVGRGYLNRPDLTAERFLRDSFTNKPEARMYRSGDLGRWLPDGNIESLGRNDFQVKIRGFRIELGEIEAVLAEYPGVREAVVIAREDTPGDKRLVAYYLSATALEAERLRTHLSKSLPEYMVPAAYVRLQTLPTLANGKLDRKALPDPSPEAFSTGQYQPPRNEVETELAAIWTSVLKRDGIGVFDNFFEAGGDSLLAFRLIARIGLKFEVECSNQLIFERPTIAGIAEFLGEHAHAKTPMPGFPPADSLDAIPLTSMQQRAWFFAQLAPDSPVYNVPLAFRLKGNLDLFKLQSSLSAIAQRHKILRTTYQERDGNVFGRACDARQVPLAIEDLSGSSGVQLEASAKEWLRRENTRIFNLESDLTMRCAVARLAPDEHMLLLVVHHIACDGVSRKLIADDLAAAYNGTLPSTPCAQLADCTAWLDARQDGINERELGWWKQQLAGMEGPTEIRGEYPRTNQNGYEGSWVRMQLDFATLLSCKEVARTHQTTVFSVLLAAYYILLQRLTGSDDLVIGTPVSIRNHPSVELMIGPFINTVVLRTSAVGNPTFREFLQRVKKTTEGALAHQEVPIDVVTSALLPGRGGSKSGLFQTIFDYHNYEKARLELNGIAAQEIDFDSGASLFDFWLDVEPNQDGLRCKFCYNTEIFERGTVEQIAAQFRSLLERALSSPGETLTQLTRPAGDGRAQVLARGQSTRVNPVACIHELFEKQAAESPDAVALVFEDHSLSYEELNCRANRLAHFLRGLGVKPDVHVAICAERGFNMVVAILAVLKAGGAYVPLDPTYPPERLRAMLNDSAPVALLADALLTGIFTEESASIPVIDLANQGLWAQRPETNLDREAVGLTPESLAYIIYTSGSTGKPKGVMVEHRHVARLFAGAESWFQFRSDDVWTLFHSYAFDFSVWEICGALFHGGRLIIVSKQTARSGDSFYALLCREKVTILNQTPSAFRSLVQAQAENKSAHSLRLIIFGGEVLEAATLQAWYRDNRDNCPQLVNGYGITEATVFSTFQLLSKVQVERLTDCPIGRPASDVSIYILDPSGEPVPAGVAGEIYAGGDGVARGYLNQPKFTAERFLEDPFEAKPGARMYRTGDVGRWLPDGSIEFLGRNDMQVKIRGYRIELGEIENRLAAYPGVRDALVMVREETPGDKRLVAYYTGDSGLDAGALRSHLSTSLPGYMVPPSYIHLASLPLTVNGKLDRSALPAPKSNAIAASGGKLHNENLEIMMARLWADVLNLAHVGIDDDFFDIGGHSLLVLKLLSRVESALGIRVPVAFLFQNPKLGQFCDALAQRRANAPALRKTRKVIPFLWLDAGPFLRPLTESLRPVCDVTQIWLRDLEWERPKPVSSLEEIASMVVDTIRESYPEGPYLLGGFCFSGSLAYETAQQLRALGYEVPLLVMIQSYTFRGRAKRTVYDRLLPRIQMEKAYFSTLTRESLAARASHWMHRVQNAFAQQRSAEEPNAEPRTYENFGTIVWQDVMGAIETYVPKPYPGRTIYFQAQDRFQTRFYDWAREWRPLIAEQGEFYQIPGSHETMVEQPNLQQISDKLFEAIQNVNDEEACKSTAL